MPSLTLAPDCRHQWLIKGDWRTCLICGRKECVTCHGTGYISRPYICGLTDPETGEKYDINTVTPCGCAAKQETEGET
jgi:hypothetical protein